MPARNLHGREPNELRVVISSVLDLLEHGIIKSQPHDRMPRYIQENLATIRHQLTRASELATKLVDGYMRVSDVYDDEGNVHAHLLRDGGQPQAPDPAAFEIALATLRAEAATASLQYLGDLVAANPQLWEQVPEATRDALQDQVNAGASKPQRAVVTAGDSPARPPKPRRRSKPVGKGSPPYVVQDGNGQQIGPVYHTFTVAMSAASALRDQAAKLGRPPSEQRHEVSDRDGRMVYAVDYTWPVKTS